MRAFRLAQVARSYVPELPAQRGGHWRHEWIPLDREALKEKHHGKIPPGATVGKSPAGTKVPATPAGHVAVWDVKAGKVRHVPKAEAAAGHQRYGAATFKAGSPARGVTDERAMKLAKEAVGEGTAKAPAKDWTKQFMPPAQAIAKARQLQAQESAGLDPYVLSKMRTSAGARDVAEARDHFDNGRYDKAVAALDRALAASEQAGEMKARVTEIRTARNRIAKGLAHPKDTPPPLIGSSRGRDGTITAYDHAGTKYQIKLTGHTVSVSSNGRTATATVPSAREATDAARRLAAGLGKPAA
jgi:hypothetical protein